MKINFSKKKVLSIAAVMVIATSVAACGSESQGQQQAAAAASSEQAAQSQDNANLLNNQPVPVYQWSQERQTKIDVENIDASGANTYSFFYNQGSQTPVFSCASIGMPVPTAAELTNPDQIIPDPNNQNTNNGNPGSVVIGNPDPTGLYTGDTTGTDVLCVQSDGHKFVAYWEGFVFAVSVSDVTINSKTGQVQIIGGFDTLSNGTNTHGGGSNTTNGVSYSTPGPAPSAVSGN